MQSPAITSFTSSQKRNIILVVCLVLIVAINIVNIKIYNEKHVAPDELKDKTILVTGAAGFIGFHLSQRLVELGNRVVGIDNYNDYYDQELKRVRGNTLINKQIHVEEGDICDKKLIEKMFREYEFTHIAHLAAQAGVRYSLENPKSYVTANLMCTLNLLEAIRYYNTDIKFIYASSSSVYGRNKKIPFSERDVVDHPSNIYGASKKAMEHFCLVYHELFGIHVTGLRFFTVYGPYGRPDMAIYMWAKSIAANKPLKLYEKKENGVNVVIKRDFTYVDDIVKGIVGSLSLAAPHEVFNLGNNTPEEITKLIHFLGKNLGRPKPRITLKPLPKADITMTFADVAHAKKRLGFAPTTSLEQGVVHFVDWFREYYYPKYVVYISMSKEDNFKSWFKTLDETPTPKRFIIFVPPVFPKKVINAYTTLNMRFVVSDQYGTANNALYAEHLQSLLSQAPADDWQVKRALFVEKGSTTGYDSFLFSTTSIQSSSSSSSKCSSIQVQGPYPNAGFIAGQPEHLISIFHSNEYKSLSSQCKDAFVKKMIKERNLPLSSV